MNAQISGNGNSQHPIEVATPAPEVKRLRASGPILLLAVLFVLGAFLSWYFSWFGRELSDADIASYLVDHDRPRHVQHALLQVQQRIERGDPAVVQWYPQIALLASSPEKEFRLTTAWLMGFDNKSEDFHRALLQLVKDPEPIVRRNAALALVRFNDTTGRAELTAILEPYALTAPVDGTVASTLQEGAQVSRGALVLRIDKATNQPTNEATNQSTIQTVEVRSPLPGSVAKIVTPGGNLIASGATVLTINSDEDSIWEALRALSLIGESGDLTAVESFANSSSGSERIKQQAALTAKAIRSRENSKTVKD